MGVELAAVLLIYGLIDAVVIRAYMGVRRRPEYTWARRIALSVGLVAGVANLPTLGVGIAGDIRQDVVLRLVAFASQALALFTGAGVAFVMTLAALSILRWALLAIGSIRRAASPSVSASSPIADETSSPKFETTTRLIPEVRREKDANDAVLASLGRHITQTGYCGQCGRERDAGSPTFCRFCGFRLAGS